MKTMSASREIPPPWVAFPYMEWPSDGSGGPAAFHMWTWTNWFGALSAEAKGNYKKRYPEPARWAGFYDLIESGKPPFQRAFGDESVQFDSDFEIRDFYEMSPSDPALGLAGGVRDPIDRLVILLISEAITLGFNGIEIWDREPTCLIYYVRGDEKQERDAPPRRLYDPFKLRLARMCGIEDCRGTGTFATRLALPEASSGRDCEGTVSVEFGDSCLHLTIINH
jgi:hypothetical protein